MVVCALLVSCSLGIQQVPKNWDGTTEPECDDSWGPVIGDSIVGGIAAGIGLGASDSKDNNADVFAIGGFAVGLVFLIAAGVGEERVRDCKTAQTAWRVGGAVGFSAASAMRARDPDAAVEDPPQRRRGRGWFCASSETAAGTGLCNRERRACEQARESAAAAAPDLEPCEPVEAAWCFLLIDGRERCAASEDACKEKRAHTSATVRIECEERR